MKFSAYCAEWRGRVLPRLAISAHTRTDYARALRHDIERLDVPLDALSAQAIRQFLSPWLHDRPHNYNRLLTVIQRVLRDAVDEGLIPSNPARDVRRRQLPETRPYMPDEDYAAIVGALPEWARMAVNLMYLTSARPSTVLALQDSDITRQDGYVLLRYTATKNRQGMELADLEHSAMDGVIQWLQLEKQRLGIDSPILITRPDGSPCSVNYVSRMFGQASRAMGLQWCLRDVRPKSYSDEVRTAGHSDKLADRSDAMKRRYARLPMRAKNNLSLPT